MPGKKGFSIKQEVKGLVFVVPAFSFLAIFTLYPMINAILNSFYNWNLGGRKRFVGLYNYQKMFSADEIYMVLRNTLVYVVSILPFTIVLGFLLAVFLKRKSKLNVVYRTMIFTPHIASMVGLSVVWLYIFNPQYGILNKVLTNMGLAPLRWVNDSSTALLSIVIVTVWRMLGYNVIVYLGAIQNIPQEVIEAAHIDGAKGIRTVWNIIMPLVSPSTFMLLILNTISVMKLFTTIENMTGGGPGTSTANLVMMLYEYAFRQYQMGYASAIAVLLFLLILAINLVQMSFERYVNYDV
ncbi:MAG: sugar ABC transporter permease [Sphaerochaetaceae bacterium]|nr:sugar ABC transporter permease [Sphaerochaetaceae bacterium]